MRNTWSRWGTCLGIGPSAANAACASAAARRPPIAAVFLLVIGSAFPGIPGAPVSGRQCPEPSTENPRKAGWRRRRRSVTSRLLVPGRRDILLPRGPIRDPQEPASGGGDPRRLPDRAPLRARPEVPGQGGVDRRPQRALLHLRPVGGGRPAGRGGPRAPRL